MRNYRFGRNNIRVLLCCMVAGWILWYFFGPCQIILIKNSLEVLPPDEYRKYWLVGDTFIVVRPPNSLTTLRKEISEYDKKYPLDIELVNQKIKNIHEQIKDIAPDAPIKCVRLFYKNTSDTPLDWNGKRDEDKEGMEADHTQDLIGVINWIKGDLVKEYTCIKRIDWSHSQRIFFYKDGRTKFLEYIRGDEGKETKEYYLDNWY